MLYMHPPRRAKRYITRETLYRDFFKAVTYRAVHVVNDTKHLPFSPELVAGPRYSRGNLCAISDDAAVSSRLAMKPRLNLKPCLGDLRDTLLLRSD